jgi:hypothetical protein
MFFQPRFGAALGSAWRLPEIKRLGTTTLGAPIQRMQGAIPKRNGSPSFLWGRGGAYPVNEEIGKQGAWSPILSAESAERMGYGAFCPRPAGVSIRADWEARIRVLRLYREDQVLGGFQSRVFEMAAS